MATATKVCFEEVKACDNCVPFNRKYLSPNLACVMMIMKEV